MAILYILESLITGYMVLLFIRVVGSYLGSSYSENRAAMILNRLCDPYLNWFRRFKLKLFVVDVSPLLAIFSLYIVGSVVNGLNAHGMISLGVVLAMLLQGVWSIGALLLLLTSLAQLVAIVFTCLLKKEISLRLEFVRSLAGVCNDLVRGLFFSRRFISECKISLISLVALVALRVLGDLLIDKLVGFLVQIPF